MEKTAEETNLILERINDCIASRKPALLALFLVDLLREKEWSPDDIHFLGCEIMNESGAL